MKASIGIFLLLLTTISFAADCPQIVQENRIKLEREVLQNEQSAFGCFEIIKEAQDDFSKKSNFLDFAGTQKGKTAALFEVDRNYQIKLIDDKYSCQSLKDIFLSEISSCPNEEVQNEYVVLSYQIERSKAKTNGYLECAKNLETLLEDKTYLENKSDKRMVKGSLESIDLEFKQKSLLSDSRCLGVNKDQGKKDQDSSAPQKSKDSISTQQ